jgi:hypothetical protein
MEKLITISLSLPVWKLHILIIKSISKKYSTILMSIKMEKFQVSNSNKFWNKMV